MNANACDLSTSPTDRDAPFIPVRLFTRLFYDMGNRLEEVLPSVYFDQISHKGGNPHG